MSLVGDLIGKPLTSLGTALHLPDLGIGKALGDQTALPGALQGVNSSKYAGVAGVQTDPRLTPVTFAKPIGDQQQQQDQGIAQQGVYGGSAGGGSAGGAGTYDANYDPGLVSQARGMVNGDSAQLQSLYNTINSAISNYAGQARGTVDSSLANALKSNDNSLKSSVNGATSAFGSRNTLDSSDYGNTLDSFRNSYNDSNKSAQDQANAGYAQIGSTIQGAQSQVANHPNYDLSNYTDVNSLTNLHNQLGQYIAQLQQTSQSLTPQGDLVKKLNSVAPVTSGLQQNLQAKLQNLVSSGADPAAANILAKGYLSQAGVDPNDPTWNNYFQSLIGQKSATAGGTSAPAATLNPDQLNKTLIGAA